MITLNVSQVIGELSHWSMTSTWCIRYSGTRKRQTAGSEGIETKTISTLVCELTSINLSKEQACAAQNSITHFVDDILIDGPAPCR